MKTTSTKMTLRQERLAYRRAVLELLTIYFEKTPAAAGDIVDAWWKRMDGSAVFAEGLFLHDEPINTAADLAKVRKPPAVRDLGKEYRLILDRSLPKQRSDSSK